ncbi:MAG: hypothetical protein QOE94_145, partial [Mycobacterium sp.]|nr:hypothetical protein [Mycobacterium sp.]
VAPSIGRAAGEGQVAIASQEYHPVTLVDAGRLVRRQDDCDPARVSWRSRRMTSAANIEALADS